MPTPKAPTTNNPAASKPPRPGASIEAVVAEVEKNLAPPIERFNSDSTNLPRLGNKKPAGE